MSKIKGLALKRKIWSQVISKLTKVRARSSSNVLEEAVSNTIIQEKCVIYMAIANHMEELIIK